MTQLPDEAAAKSFNAVKENRSYSDEVLLRPSYLGSNKRPVRSNVVFKVPTNRITPVLNISPRNDD